MLESWRRFDSFTHSCDDSAADSVVAMEIRIVQESGYDINSVLHIRLLVFLCALLFHIGGFAGCSESRPSTLEPNNEQADKPWFVVPRYSSIEPEPSFVMYQSVSARPHLGGISPWVNTRVIFAVWRDGSVVWSSNGPAGGPPYMEASIDRERVADRLEDIYERAARSYGEEDVDIAHYGPDSSFTVMLLWDHPKTIQLSSWHELYGANTNLVVTDAGIESLNGRSRESVMAQASPDYREFLEVWSSIREAAHSLIPHQGKVNTSSTFSLSSRDD